MTSSAEPATVRRHASADALPSFSLRGLGRLFFFAAVIDGLSTSGLVSIPLLGAHLMGYRLFLAFSVVAVALHAVTEPGAARDHRVRVWGYLGFIGASGVFALTSVAWVVDRALAWRQIGFFLEGALFIALAVGTLRSPAKLERLARIWLVIMIVATCIGIWEAATGSHLPGSGLLETDERLAEEYSNMPTAWFRNANNFAFFLVFSFAIALAWLRHRSRGWTHGATQIAIGLMCVALVFTRARIIYVAAAIAWVTWAALPWLAKRRRFPRLRASHVILILVLSIVLLFTRAGAMFTNQVVSLQETFTTELAGDPRLQLGKEVLDVLIKSHGLGVGAGNIEVYLEQYTFSYEAGVTNPHGWWVEIAGNYGVIGFMGLSIFYLALLHAIWRAYRRRMRKGDRPAALEAALVGLVAYPAASFGPSSIAGFPVHWIFLAFCLAALNVYRLGRATRPCESSPS